MFDGYTMLYHIFPCALLLHPMFPLCLMIIYDVSICFQYFLMVWLFRIFIILCFVIPHFSNMSDGYTPCLQYCWCLYIYIPICFMVMPYVSHIFGLYYIIRHFWSQSFSYVWVIPIFLMVLRCSSLYFRWLYPYVWWLYHMVVPHGRKPSKSSASAAASARSQVRWKIQVVDGEKDT